MPPIPTELFPVPNCEFPVPKLMKLFALDHMKDGPPNDDGIGEWLPGVLLLPIFGGLSVLQLDVDVKANPVDWMQLTEGVFCLSATTNGHMGVAATRFHTVQEIQQMTENQTSTSRLLFFLRI